MDNLTVGSINLNNIDPNKIVMSKGSFQNQIHCITPKQYKIKTDDLTIEDIKLMLSKITFSDYHWLNNIVPEHLKEEV